VQVLSKAFRNRFLELHIGDIPDDELASILQHRCQARPAVLLLR
jgi:midasin